jgi:hypothetical protein
MADGQHDRKTKQKVIRVRMMPEIQRNMKLQKIHRMIFIEFSFQVCKASIVALLRVSCWQYVIHSTLIIIRE